MKKADLLLVIIVSILCIVFIFKFPGYFAERPTGYEMWKAGEQK